MLIVDLPAEVLEPQLTLFCFTDSIQTQESGNQILPSNCHLISHCMVRFMILGADPCLDLV